MGEFSPIMYSECLILFQNAGGQIHLQTTHVNNNK